VAVQTILARRKACGTGNRHYVRTRTTSGRTPGISSRERMIELLLFVKVFCPRRMLSVVALLACFSTAAMGANYITGSVRNQSRGEPSAGDDVILARLDIGMQEEARAKTNSQGAFNLNVQYPDKPYLVRVFHQGVSYDQQASAGQALSIKVFDAATHVQGITGTIEILRTGTVGNLLHVSDMVEIKNESSPPLTQAGERTFEVYLPANAKIDSVLAAGLRGRQSIVAIDRSAVVNVKGSLKAVTSAYRDPQGTIWIGEEDGLWRYTSNGLSPVPLPEGLDPLFHIAQTMTMDRSGGLWVSFLHTGFMYYAHEQWTKPAFPSAAVHDPGLTAYTDSEGRVWFGLGHSRVEVLSGAEKIRYGPEAGIDVGDVTAIYERSGQIWLGGKVGLEFQKQNRFLPLHLAGDTAIEGVSGIVQTASGDLWVNQASGVLRIGAQEVARAIKNPEYRARFVLYNYLDGLSDAASQIRPNPTVIQTESGRLYVATRTGVVWIDPDYTKTATPRPHVFVKSISVDGKLTRDVQDLRLPVHANAIEIDYTATSVLIPERVRFRYKLEGFDTDWQEVGSRRQAFYSALPPGRYRFRVLACNSDGLWSGKDASLGFEIPPSFLQSLSFKVICVVLAVALLALLYRIRLRLLMRQVRTRLYERLAERERIARDLHDTFFQAIQGLLLRFNTGTSMLKQDEPARAIFEDALKQSDQVMMGGRELLLDLRTGSGEASNLSEAFVNAEGELRKIRDTDYKVIVQGEPKDLHPVVFEEAYRLGREALVNAFQHSQASLIEAELTYERSGLRLRFRDDGVGLDPKTLREGRRDNHWGLPGMRERAKKMGAQIEIWSRNGAGTEIEVWIPASVAYLSTKKSPSSRLLLVRFWKEHEFL